MKLPRCTLRDLFWLTLVVALALGWSVHWQRTSGRQNKLVAENEMYRQELNMLMTQLENEGYTIVQSSIGPFLQRRDSLP